jgi:AcrR family transcriptional regulator
VKKTISEDTRRAVLEAAWELMSTQGRLDVGMAEIAQAAGVSRQTLFYAFGNRAGLLVAMVRHKDSLTDHVAQLSALARGDGADAATLHAFLDVWLRYLPEVYPVAIQLEAGALTDTDAALAFADRFYNQGLRRGLERILGRMAAAGALRPGQDPARLADLCLSLLLPSAWRALVIDSGWAPAAFAASRHVLVDAALAPAGSPNITPSPAGIGRPH